RLDAESAHERPSFVDILEPERASVFPVFLPAKTLVLTRSGNPALGARSMRGVLAAASFVPRAGREVVLFGSIRRVANDFGWDVTRAETADSLFLTQAASERGDGWVAQTAAGGAAGFGPFALRGLAWVRGGTSGLSPQDGSPPRAGADAALTLRA